MLCQIYKFIMFIHIFAVVHTVLTPLSHEKTYTNQHSSLQNQMPNDCCYNFAVPLMSVSVSLKVTMFIYQLHILFNNCMSYLKLS